MSDHLRRESEPLRHLLRQVAEPYRRKEAVERGVHPDGIELCGLVGEFILRGAWIEVGKVVPVPLRTADGDVWIAFAAALAQ